MRVTQLLAPTLREVPAEAEVISHRLMLRAGMIRKTTSGVYTYLPLAQRILQKIAAIVREEMNRAGGLEVGLPIMQPAELWQESGRWAVYGDEMFRLQDRHQRDFCLGPTHEEIITDLVRNEVHSYKQLPLLLYQIQNKYRDERRPRFGLMRCREFIMKDLYSFDRDEAGLEVSYQKMYNAYSQAFQRCGLQFRAVEADSGAIGGNASHEFMVLAGSGEALVVHCDQCGYAANVEKAEASPELLQEGLEPGALQRVHTPGVCTVVEVTTFLGISAQEVLKTLFYEAEFTTHRELIAVVIRGDRNINETKLLNRLGCLRLELASDTLIKKTTGASPGFVGPIGLKGIRILVDTEVPLMVQAVVGANQDDYHYRYADPGRDFPLDEVADLRMVEAVEPCPHCGNSLVQSHGIEVGHIFKLGTKYSSAMGARFLDEKGQEQLIVMGCYGIGVSRTMAAAIEQNYDANGIKWPVAIAPYHVIIVPVSFQDEQQRTVAEKLYNGLLKVGVEAILDDRLDRAGVKFKDADLIGYPYRITIGPKALKDGEVEVRCRITGEDFRLKIEEVVQWLADQVHSQLHGFV
ncbi:MAG: proline--tRNA ligase [Syntrophomonadaceae bacterium]|nr:proline--tRNA ligase [Syntrophomonadaceae bacterium]